MEITGECGYILSRTYTAGERDDDANDLYDLPLS